MDALGGAAVSAEEGRNNYSDNISRRGRGRDGGNGGHRYSGSYNNNNNQKWIPTESRSGSSSAARLSKPQEITKKPGAVSESSAFKMNNGVPSSAQGTGVSSSSNDFRASGKVHSIDRRLNDDHERTAKDNTSLRGDPAGAIHSRGEGKDNASAVVEVASSFVPYLPQDDAVVVGLGEREGGVDASETQEVTDLLNEQLSALLCLPPRQFWKIAATDESLSVFLDSYLHFRRRWFDIPLGRPNVSLVAGDADLSRRVFMVLLRMSSNHDPGTPAREILSAKEHAAILQDKRLLDIPKLMDLSAIYGHDNPDLTQRLVSNVFKVLPGYTGELAAYIPSLLERIYTMHRRCYRAIEVITNPTDKGTTGAGFSALHGEFLEVVDFLNDVMLTLKAFVKAYPPAAKILVSSGNPISGQGLFLQALATVHDTLLPILQKGFAILNSSAEDQLPESTEIRRKQNEAEVAADDRLRTLSARLVELVWKLLELQYFAETPTEESSKSYEAAVWKSDSLVQAIVSLGPSDNDEDSFGGELSSSVARLICTGALLQSVERFHGLSFQILQAREKGTVVLDDAQQNYLFALLADTKPPNGGQDNSLTISTESFPLLTLPEKEADEETVIQQSKISQIKDLFPDYGDGFVAACLEVYDNDPEKVIERILDGTLHSDLSLLDTSLRTKPEKLAQPVKDKGKGKVSEEAISSKGKSIWEDKSSTKGSGSSSSLAVKAGPSSGYSEGSLPEEPSVHAGSNLGRYVRRQKDDGKFSDLLDSRNENQNEDIRAAIRAAAAKNENEYEDEYDDSFDELGGYAADAGGNEETETFIDQVARRGRVHDENVGMRDTQSGRPVVLAPWGSPSTKGTGNPVAAHRASSQPQRSAPVVPEVEGQYHHTVNKGRGNSVGAQRASYEPQKSAPVVPEVEGQNQDTATNSTAGQGRGGRGGRGRKKWKEQGPKPEFYLKDGKLYSYKVPGAVGVANLEEAEAIKQEEAETIHGLGAGGNVPMAHQDNSSGGNTKDTDGNSKSWKGGAPGDSGRQNFGNSGEGGRGRGASGRGRGAPGRGSHGRRDDNHHRKDQATKKHFGGLGGL